MREWTALRSWVIASGGSAFAECRETSAGQNTSSTYDSYIAVYTGSSVSTLTPVAANDDSCGVQSSVTFAAVAGTTYRIAVDGYGGVAGAVTLHLGLV